MIEAFDGGRNRLYEFCNRVTPLLEGQALREWWAEHDKRCPGPGKCHEGPPVRVCDVEFSPPRWLVAALKARPRPCANDTARSTHHEIKETMKS
jgi:hypothetical protein